MTVEITKREAASAAKVLDILGPIGRKIEDFIGLKVLEAKVSRNEDGSMVFEISNERTDYLVRRFFEIGVGIAPHLDKIHDALAVVKAGLAGDLGRDIKKKIFLMRERYSSPHAYSIKLHLQDDATELVLVDTDIDRQNKKVVGDSYEFGEFDPDKKKRVESLGTFRSRQEAEEMLCEIGAFGINYAKAHGHKFVGDVILAMYGD